MKRIAVVDENDTLVGYKERDAIIPKDIYRVAALWIADAGSANILLAKRALIKDHDPGKWGPAAAGTVEEWETYETNIVKEAEEELGLAGIKPIEGPKERITGDRNYFGQWYLLELKKESAIFGINPEEVAEVKWFAKEELRKRLHEAPEEFLPGAAHWEELFLGGPVSGRFRTFFKNEDPK